MHGVMNGVSSPMGVPRSHEGINVHEGTNVHEGINLSWMIRDFTPVMDVPSFSEF
jgi:hypothetical protein